MPLRPCFLVGLVALGAGAAPLAAQDAALEPGARVRVTRPGQPVLTAAVVRASRDSLWLALLGTALPTPIALAGSKIEVSRGLRSRVVPGALIGLAVGAVVTTGFLTGFCGGDNACDGDEQVRAALVFGLPSVALGAGIGLLIKRESWKEIGRLAPGPGGGAGTTLIGVSVSW